MTPELVAEFVRSFQEEVNKAARDVGAQRTTLEQEMKRLDRKIAGILKAIEDGMYASSLKTRMQALETRRSEIEASLAQALEPPVLRLHPNLAGIYHRKISELESALNADGIKTEAAEILRSLIDRVVLTPEGNAVDGLAAALTGDLAAILALCESGKNKKQHTRKLPGANATGSQLSVVAGEGFEPSTFRL